MSIATLGRHAEVRTRIATSVAPAPRRLTPREELREARGLVRHFVLAFTAAAAAIYAAIAAGVTF